MKYGRLIDECTAIGDLPQAIKCLWADVAAYQTQDIDCTKYVRPDLFL